MLHFPRRALLALFGLIVAILLVVQHPLLADAQEDFDEETYLIDLATTPPPGEMCFEDGFYCPAEVLVALDVIDIPDINQRDGVVEIDATLGMFWFDVGVGDVVCGSEFTDVRVYQADGAREVLKQIWWPEVVLKRGIGPRDVSALAVTVDCSDLSVLYEERFTATVAQTFRNLNDFPFDTQELSFTLMSSAQDNTRVRIVALDEFFGTSLGEDESELAGSLAWQTDEWHVDQDRQRDRFFDAVIINPMFDDTTDPDFFVDAEVSDTYYGDNDRRRASTTFKVDISRKSRFYVYNVMLPLMLIVAISWSVFWGNLGPMSLAEKLGVSITSLLTVVAFDFLTGDSLPRVSFTTRLDVFYNFSYLFVALTVIVSIVSARVRRDSDIDDMQPTKLDRWSRIAFPTAYAAAVAISLIGLLSPGQS